MNPENGFTPERESKGGERKERIRAGRILAELRDEISPEVDLHNVVKSQLAHSGEIKKIDEKFVEDLVKGNLDKKQIAKTDGLITNLKDYPLYISAADCYPVAVFDPKHKAIGAFHNGVWGYLSRIVPNGLRAMRAEYGTDPQDIKVVIAPGISEQKYTVPRETFEQAKIRHSDLGLDRYVRPTDNPDELSFDLAAAIVDSLTEQGVKPENIEMSKYKTDVNNDLFPSERVEGNKDRDSYGFMIVLK